MNTIISSSIVITTIYMHIIYIIITVRKSAKLLLDNQC